jgi:hypothetical protein
MQRYPISGRRSSKSIMVYNVSVLANCVAAFLSAELMWVNREPCLAHLNDRFDVLVVAPVAVSPLVLETRCECLPS